VIILMLLLALPGAARAACTDSWSTMTTDGYAMPSVQDLAMAGGTGWIVG
jgi:hypothetical protein